MTPDGARELRAFREAQATLAAALARLAAVQGGLDAPERARQLAEARAALLDARFRVLVGGEFKRGKSTLINALLGAAVLPARVAPCTGVLTAVVWAETPSARAFPLDGGPPVPVPVEELRAYVGLDEDAAPPWARVELGWPLPLVRDGVELIDAPGLNEDPARDALVVAELPRVDALVVVLSCEQPLSASERAFLDRHVGRAGLRHVFVAWNRADALDDDPGAAEEVRARTSADLAPRLAAPDRVFHTRAREALRARLDGRPAPPETGLPALEAALWAHLAGARGAAKLEAPLALAEAAVRELLAVRLPRRERLLAAPVEAERGRLDALRPRLDALQRERVAVTRAVTRRRDTLARELKAAWLDEVGAIGAALPEVAAGVELGAWEVVVASADARRKLATALGGWLEERVEAWRARVVDPLVARHAAALEADLDARLAPLVRELDAVRDAVLPEGAPRVGEGEALPPRARVLGAVGGLVVGGVGAALEGAAGGVEGMLRGLGYHLALAVGLAALGVSGPVIVAAGAALGVARLGWSGGSAARATRVAVAEELTRALRGTEVEARLDGAVAEAFARVEVAVDGGLGVAIEALEAEVAEASRARARGEEALAAERARLDAVRAELLELATTLDRVRARGP